MTPIPYPAPDRTATAYRPTPAEGHLAILRRLFLRAGCGVLTREECRMGVESVAALEQVLDERHAERLRQVCHD